MVERQERPRVLLVTRNFPPLLGGMERLNWHMADALRAGCDLRVVAPAGAAAHVPRGVAVREVPLKPLRRFLLHAMRAARLEASRWRPHLVLAGSGLTAPAAWWAARVCGARTAAYVHGLDLTVSHPVYRAVWLAALRHMDRILANSSATAALAEGTGIQAQRISVIPPGAETPAPDSGARARFRLAHGISPQASLLLAVGRLTERKGIREFVTDVLPHVARRRPDVVFAVVGDVPANALRARAQSPASILQAASGVGLGSRIRLLGTIGEADLHDAYFAADLHVFPVRHMPNDVEGFGMVAVEAAAHGLSTVAYACGGVIDAVGAEMSGRLVTPGDEAGFVRAVVDLLERPLDPGQVRRFAQTFAWSRFDADLSRALGLLHCLAS